MMNAWYIPAWNGDWRLEPHSRSPEKLTRLVIKRPTSEEKRVLKKLRDAFASKGWVSTEGAGSMQNPSRFLEKRVLISAPLAEVGPVVASIVKPGPNVLTAVRSKGGRIEVCETSAPSRARLDEDAPASKDPYRTSASGDAPKKEKKEEKEEPFSTPSEASKALAKKEDATAAATVQRPTPCCPDCFVDKSELNKPATEVLLAFMNEEEHVSWARDRFVVVRGGITGHRYLIAHRNSLIAQTNRRMCFDLDDNQVMHFHSWLVPAEEEVLAAMLILKFREPWLRNEATALGSHKHVFKNPFGNGGDGVVDSMWTYEVGATLLNMLAPKRSGPTRAVLTDGSGNSTLVDTNPEIWMF